MAHAVHLEKILEALELQFDGYASYLDLDSGEVHTLSEELIGAAEEAGEDAISPPEDLEIEFEDEEWEAARRVAFSNRLVALPTQFDIDEWAIMRNFAIAQDDQRLRDELLHAIRGAGAFRHFKSTVRGSGAEGAWYAFRDQAFRQIAIDWCGQHDIAWE